MATDTERFEMLSLIVELILNEGEGVSPEDLLRALKFHEAASAGYNMFKLRGRELVDCAMNAVRFDEVGPAKSMELVQQMIDERTDTETLNWLQTELDAGREIEMFVTPGRVPGTDSEKVVRTRIIYGSMSNHSKAIGIDLRSSLKTLREYVEPSAPSKTEAEYTAYENGGLGT